MTADFAERAVDAIVEDRRLHSASDWPPAERVFETVSGELRPLVYQIAEMAEHEPHQLVAAAEYLHGLLEREPLRSSPTWDAQRVVLGLFLMGLSSALAATEVITAGERAALRPAYMRAAGEAVREAFDPTYIPTSDHPEEAPVAGVQSIPPRPAWAGGPPQPEEATATSQPAPETTDADLLALL